MGKSIEIGRAPEHHKHMGERTAAPRTEIYLFRHGRTEWNDLGRWQGQADAPLNEEGRRQAEELAMRWKDKGFSAIYSSDLQRARVTAEPLARQCGLSIHLEPRLREIHLGEWQALYADEIEARWPCLLRQWREDADAVRPPAGETLAEVEARVLEVLQEIAARHLGQTVAVFTHKLPIALVRCRLRGWPRGRFWELIPDNAGWIVLEGDEEGPLRETRAAEGCSAPLPPHEREAL